VRKLLKYLNSLSATSDECVEVKAELLQNTTGIISYFAQLSGDDVSSN